MNHKTVYYKYCRHCKSVYSTKEKYCMICHGQENFLNQLLKFIKKESGTEI